MKFAYSTLSYAVLAVISSASFANENMIKPNQQQETTVTLNPIIAKAEKEQEAGKTVYTKEDLEKTPNSSKNITDFLKVNPNVQFDRKQRAAGTIAELKPAEISINGAQTFQNKYIVNGVNNTNTLDPMGTGTSFNGQLESGSQGMAINTDLLCKLEVLDSNISAEYGEFTGGVVKANTCAPNTQIGKIHGSITYDYTESDWARYNTTPADSSLTEKNPNTIFKEFKKQGLSLNAYTKLNENLGINIYGSQRESIIPLNSGLESPKFVDQERENINLGSTIFYNNNTLNAKFGFDFGDLNSFNYINGRRNSGNIVQGKTSTTYGEISHLINKIKVTHNLSYQNLDNVRKNDENEGRLWYYSAGSKDWADATTIGEGSASSDINLKQESYSYSTKAELDKFKIADSEHSLSMGVGYSHFNVSWERLFDTYSYTTRKNLNGQQCLENDELCDTAITGPINTTGTIYNGQYISLGTLYKNGTFKAEQDRLYAFIQNEIKWENISARFGLRSDHDSLTHNFNIAPRTSFSYKPFSTDILNITTGWNRYYGTQTLSTELQDSIMDLQYSLTRSNQTSAWQQTPSINYNSTRRSDLKTPFTDEVSLGVFSTIKNWDIGLKWVNRQFKDEISRYKNIDKPINNIYKWSYEYNNAGKGKADIFTLTLKNNQPFELLESLHQFNFGFDYSDVYRSVPDYTANFDEDVENQMISYDGKIMRYADRPATNFNQPWTARLGWDIELRQIPLRINNFLSYQSSYKDMIKELDKVPYGNDGEMITSYQPQKIKPRFSWDLRTTYDYKINQNYNMIFGLTINNLTNKHNSYAYDSKVYSEIGRQFIADVTFKF